MRKMLNQPKYNINNKRKSTGVIDGAVKENNPFDEDDVGKRFQLLKQQMEEEEERQVANAGAISPAPQRVAQKVRPGDPAGPASGGTTAAAKKHQKSAQRIPQYDQNGRPIAAEKPWVTTDQLRNKKAQLRGQPQIQKKASQIVLSRPIEEEPATVSYNTKVFNKEITALRNEEEALLKY